MTQSFPLSTHIMSDQENSPANDILGDGSPQAITDSAREPETKSKKKPKALTFEQVPLHLPILDHYLAKYPKLELTPYAIENDKDALNALSLVHNAARREIVDLVSIVLPTLLLIPHSNDTSELHPDMFPLKPWWDALLRFFFFVADTDDDITRIATDPVVEITARSGQLKISRSLEKNRKSLTDRYAFAMEYVFRAADRALDDYCHTSTSASLSHFVVKVEAVVTFVLDSMHVADDVVNHVNEVCIISLPSLQRKVVDSLCTFAKERKNIFICICVRWMDNEQLIKQWIYKYGGFKARYYFDSWKLAHDEQRASFIEILAQKYNPS